jgi:hypothetical protein
MSEVMTASIRDQLWHRMRQDLMKFVPAISGNQLLMCCACGRFLPQECFDLDHLIPQQALKQDPKAVRANPATPANTRAGNLLLCKKPLKIKGSVVHGNGCNSWKGKFYDKAISQLISTTAFHANKCTDVQPDAARRRHGDIPRRADVGEAVLVRIRAAGCLHGRGAEFRHAGADVA